MADIFDRISWFLPVAIAWFKSGDIDIEYRVKVVQCQFEAAIDEFAAN
jgi:hypothetical protein